MPLTHATARHAAALKPSPTALHCFRGHKAAPHCRAPAGEHGRGCLKPSPSDWCVLCELESLATQAYGGGTKVLNPRPLVSRNRALLSVPGRLRPVCCAHCSGLPTMWGGQGAPRLALVGALFFSVPLQSCAHAASLLMNSPRPLCCAAPQRQAAGQAVHLWAPGVLARALPAHDRGNRGGAGALPARAGGVPQRGCAAEPDALQA